MQAAETVYEFGSSPDDEEDQTPAGVAGGGGGGGGGVGASGSAGGSTSNSLPPSGKSSQQHLADTHQHHLSHHHLTPKELENTSIEGSNTSLTSSTQSGNQSVNLSFQKASGHQSSSSSSQQQNPNFDSNVISERVKNLATQIYQELKRIISRCNYDEDILSGLMPLIVRVLESLDLALIENQQLQVELELFKDDNEQLVEMFEKEKKAKRAIDKKLIKSEYAYEEERQQYQQKIESLNSTIKMFELKAKNASDQAARLEEKEVERKKEYSKLHERYTELLKSHCDFVAKSKQRSADDQEFERASLARSGDPLKSWHPEAELTLEDASLVVIEDILDTPAHPKTAPDLESSHNESERAMSEPDGEREEKESENDSIAYTSMEKEFRKLIQENKDLLNTKNALNVVKDDLIAEVDRLTNEVSMYEQAVEQLNLTKDQMKQKVASLESILRKTKEELERAKQKIKENNEEEVPPPNRKRFNRAEMAKVLMERNSYKERFMELQDAVRFNEVLRANKVETEKRSGLWKFFSNLFGAPPREFLAIGPATQTVLSYSRNSSPIATASIANNPSSAAVVGSDVLQSPVLRGGSIMSTSLRLTSNSDQIVLMDSDMNVDRNKALRDGAGRIGIAEQSGYIHAYGWSLPLTSIKGAASRSSLINTSTPQKTALSLLGSDTLTSTPDETNYSKLISTCKVPIPQHCRPLSGDSVGMKIWCATAIDVSGGEAKSDKTTSEQSYTLTQQVGLNSSSGSVVNISSSTPIKSTSDQALSQLEQEVTQALNESRLDDSDYIGNVSLQKPILVSNEKENLSSHVWICSTQHSKSKISIIDIESKPNDILDSFYVPTFLYCMKSIPGVKGSDLVGIEVINTSEEPSSTSRMIKELISNQKKNFYQMVQGDAPSAMSTMKTASGPDDTDTEISRILDDNVSEGVAVLQKLNDFVAHTQPQTSPQQESSSSRRENKETKYHQQISTHLPTVWMGGRNAMLYVHSAMGQWKDCVACFKLRDSILQICYFRGRAFVALADGTLCVFFRNSDTRQFEFSHYLLIDINLMAEVTSDIYDVLSDSTSASESSSQSKPMDTSAPATSTADKEVTLEQEMSTTTRQNRSKVAGIRCLEIANKNLWIGYKNRILILDPVTLKLKHSLNVIPQIDNQIRQITSVRDGVFCCLRSDLVLRLYSSLRPYQHIQNFDIEPLVTRLISPKTFVISHITAMKVVDNVLWIGNAHGIILTIPFKLVPQISETINDDEGKDVLEVQSRLSIAPHVPKCDINDAQISFHGHRDAVKFFVYTRNLMLSGGQGYLDFRLDLDDQTKPISDKSHLILWQLPK